MTMIKSTSHHTPTVTIGHLDNAGRDILDEKLRENCTIEEIIEFFKNYVPQSGIKLEIVKSGSFRLNGENENAEDHNNELELNFVRQQNKKKQGVDNSQNNLLTGQSYKKDDNNNIENSKVSGTLGKDVNASNTSEDASMRKNSNLDNGKIEASVNSSEHTSSSDENNKIVESNGVKNEPPKVKERNVFDILDADYLKRMIPYMHPSSQKYTFGYFFDRVHEVCDGKNLEEKDTIDVMQFRMGGSYLSEIKDLRSKKWKLPGIEDYFLQKDMEKENEKLLKEKLMEQSKKVSC